ncbi:hypothetical protein U1Q18_051629 [Sarracenia purpurea var. burkii]
MVSQPQDFRTIRCASTVDNSEDSSSAGITLIDCGDSSSSYGNGTESMYERIAAHVGDVTSEASLVFYMRQVGIATEAGINLAKRMRIDANTEITTSIYNHLLQAMDDAGRDYRRSTDERYWAPIYADRRDDNDLSYVGRAVRSVLSGNGVPEEFTALPADAREEHYHPAVWRAAGREVTLAPPKVPGEVDCNAPEHPCNNHDARRFPRRRRRPVAADLQHGWYSETIDPEGNVARAFGLVLNHTWSGCARLVAPVHAAHGAARLSGDALARQEPARRAEPRQDAADGPPHQARLHADAVAAAGARRPRGRVGARRAGRQRDALRFLLGDARPRGARRVLPGARGADHGAAHAAAALRLGAAVPVPGHPLRLRHL